MERNVVSLELAKKLKEAGFGLDEAIYWWRFHKPNGASQLVEKEWQRSENSRYLSDRPEHIRYREENDFYPAPTAQELADALPKEHLVGETSIKGCLEIYWSLTLKRWCAGYYDEEAGAANPSALEQTADTMADALALLWLEIEDRDAN